ncbi:amino-acid racemase [Brumimicrobium salinarum]|uniref:Amino-acid racemase n=1 Tax=Brumimicrobium salinarum TaxID=2058658 RepID=A0A2I0R2L4_9FLAO|nr:alanine racemase [Brumimicrobium salinarum]PKR80824.1 amino-acid racemase [Brumimicrobium salinarum]
MATLKIKSSGIIDNILAISSFLQQHEIHWSLITKVFSGDVEFMKQILKPEVIENIHSIGDSRLTSLKNIKKVNPSIRTIYIKPPAKIYAKEIVEFADVSLNTSIHTLKALDKAAKEQQKIHKVIIMIELGELREGVLGNKIIDFYRAVFALKNVETIGLGANLGCMYGVEPTYDKLMQLELYGKLIEATFDKKLALFSGGSSITLPLLEENNIPKSINHFRIGEAAFFGTSPLRNQQFLNLSTDNFRLSANLIEIEEKRIIPQGEISEASIGDTKDYDESHYGKRFIGPFLILEC